MLASSSSSSTSNTQSSNEQYFQNGLLPLVNETPTNLYTTTQLALLAQKQRAALAASIPQCLISSAASQHANLLLNQQQSLAANLQLRSNALAQQSLLNSYQVCPMALQQLHQNQLSAAILQNNSPLLVNNANYYEGSPLIMSSQSSQLLNNTSPENKVDPNLYFNVFVGDLSPEVDNPTLMKSFEKFGQIIEAKVMIDQSSGKSRSFGFVTYWKQEDASKAIEEMNGQMVGKRPIRTNWATRQKGETRIATYEEILKAGDGSNASVYLKNVADVTEAEIRENFSKFGSIKQIRLFSSKNYGFVVYETKENAAHAIHELSGKKINGHVINCSWGRVQEQPPKTNPNNFWSESRKLCCKTTIPSNFTTTLSIKRVPSTMACVIMFLQYIFSEINWY